MTDRRSWSRGSRRLVALLTAVVAPPALTLVWLGTELVRQDRALLAQRTAERQQAAAETAARGLARALADVESRDPARSARLGVVRASMTAGRVEVDPPDAPLWWPEPPAADEAGSAFVAAEAWEFQGRPARALGAYLEAARSPHAALRAGALLRVARVHRTAGRWDEALAAYRALAGVADVSIAGAPADLQARRATVALLGQIGRRDEQRAHAAALGRDLLAGRWRIDRAAWELARAEVEAATGRPLPDPLDRRLIALAVEHLWRDRARDAPPGWQTVADGDRAVTLLVARSDPRTALVVPPSLADRWVASAMADAGTAGLALLAPGGQRVAGVASAATTTLAGKVTGLPWTIAVGPVDPAPAAREIAGRRHLLLAGLAAVLLLLGGGSYFLWRVVDRELAVGRLQADFVAAVSHEFRTPLTTLRHITELLEEDEAVPAGTRREFYKALGRNTDRLQRLVESLLDFARMEAGRRPYDLERLDAAEWAAAVVDDFRRDSAPQGVTIAMDAAPGAAPVLADRTALSNALWNLLDNAVKYSPEARPIVVSVGPHAGGVAIAVRDRGAGVPPGERREIFERFVRGERARRLGIRGTGLGLAMVAHVVRAHGGTVELDSEEGVGSTFRIVLPAAG